MMEDLLRIEHLHKSYRRRGLGTPLVRAVDGVSLSVRRGETLGIVGESGSGKTSLARCVLRLEQPDAGRVWFDGIDISRLPERRLRPIRARMQMVFQHPDTALNPRLTVRTLVGEPMRLLLRAPEETITQRIGDLATQVGLPSDVLDRYPHELSGGQKQRVGIIRALVTQPALVILDEPTSALDVSVRAEVLQLLRALQRTFGNAYLCISHDFTTVRFLADRVVVMYQGCIVESGSTDQIFTRPSHPYTRALLAAVPQPDPSRRAPPAIRLQGDILAAGPRAQGCVLAPRCPLAHDRCVQAAPPDYLVEAGHSVACYLFDQERPAYDAPSYVFENPAELPR